MLRRRNRDPQCGRRLLETHSHEIAKFHQFGLARIKRGEFLQSFVDGEQLIVVRSRRRDFDLIQIHPFGARTSFRRNSPPGAIDQNAAHRLGSRAKEMRAILKGGAFAASQPHPRFMDQRGGLKGLSGQFVAHFACGQAPKFVINVRQQFLRSPAVALLHPSQNMRDFGHSLNVRKKSSKSEVGESLKSFV